MFRLIVRPVVGCRLSSLVCLFLACVVVPEVGFCQAAGAGSGQAVGEQVATGANNDARSERLLKEVSSLVPGKFEVGTEVDSGLKEAAALFSNRKIKEAQAVLKRLESADPLVPPSGLLMAAMAYAVGDANSGKRILEATVVTNPDYPDIYFSFSQLALSQSRVTDADALADKALLTIQESAGAFNSDQLDHFKRRYYEVKYQVAKRRGTQPEAAAAAGELEKLVPDANSTIIALAEVALDAGDQQKSLDLLRRLNDNFGTSLPPEVRLAVWLQNKGKVDEAGVILKRAANEFPDNEQVHLARSRWELGQENFPEAIEAIKALEQITGDTNSTREIRGKVAFAQGAFALAESHFKRLTTDNPTNVDYANLYALALVASPEEEKQQLAVSVARQVALAKPNNPVAESSLSYVLLKTGQLKASQAVISKVARRPTTNPEVTYIIGSIVAASGRTDNAKSILEKIVDFKGLFLFRSEAKKLLKQLGQTGSLLPSPSS